MHAKHKLNLISIFEKRTSAFYFFKLKFSEKKRISLIALRKNQRLHSNLTEKKKVKGKFNILNTIQTSSFELHSTLCVSE